MERRWGKAKEMGLALARALARDERSALASVEQSALPGDEQSALASLWVS